VDRDILRRARRHLVSRDPVLGDVIRLVGPCRWADGHTDLFAALVRAITSQQLSVKAADTILGRVCALLPEDRVEAAALADLPPASLRAAGLSTRKTEYVQDLARRVRDGALDLAQLHGLPDDEVIRVLTSLRGVGRWTAEMILIFRLNRPDVLPLDDIALQRAVQRAYGLRRRPTVGQFTRLAEGWRPWRSVACWYLWASLDRPPRA
jgi:DNA-3-methyladenine glycosylase II